MTTEGEQSPAVVANNFSLTYGVRADVILSILKVYDNKGFNEGKRDKEVKKLLLRYSQSPEVSKKNDQLSKATKKTLEITKNSDIISALDWDLFSRKYYIKTQGNNSPAILAKGNVNIWYGISPKTVRALAKRLEKNQTEITAFESKLQNLIDKYRELKKELNVYASREKVYQGAEKLLEDGRLVEAEKLIESDYVASKKRQAYKGFVYGKTKELLLKYKEASVGYKDAINMDGGNPIYHSFYANNENNQAQYDKAIKHWEIAIELREQRDEQAELPRLYNNLGAAFSAKADFDQAISYFQKSLELGRKVFDENYYLIGTIYNNLGRLFDEKGNYRTAIDYFQKSIDIDSKNAEKSTSLAISYGNIGPSYESLGEFSKAQQYYEQSLEIFLKNLGKNHPYVASAYNNFGSLYYKQKSFDESIEYFRKSLQINIGVYGELHPKVSTAYNNIAVSLDGKKEYQKAITYY